MNYNNKYIKTKKSMFAVLSSRNGNTSTYEKYKIIRVNNWTVLKISLNKEKKKSMKKNVGLSVCFFFTIKSNEFPIHVFFSTILEKPRINRAETKWGIFERHIALSAKKIILLYKIVFFLPNVIYFWLNRMRGVKITSDCVPILTSILSNIWWIA